MLTSCSYLPFHLNPQEKDFFVFERQFHKNRQADFCEVVGIVLIDTSLIGKSSNVPDSALFFQESLRMMGVMRVMGNLGMLPVPEVVMYDKRSKEFLYRDFYNKDQRSELAFMASADEDHLKMLQEAGLGNPPVMILSSRAEEAEHKDWQKSQNELLQLSTDSKRIIVEDTSHYIHHDQPKIVIDSVMEIVEKIR